MQGIRALRHIRSSLTTEACKTVAAAIVGRDSTTVTLSLTGTSVSKFDSPAACSEHICSGSCPEISLLPHYAFLADLHRLPIRHRINFKIATIAFKVLHCQQPSLSHRPCPTVCDLRSSSSLLICIPLKRNLQLQGPSRSHPLPRTLGIGYHVIFHPFPLFLLSGRDSSIIFSQLLSPVFPLHPLTSRFVMSSHPRK